MARQSGELIPEETGVQLLVLYCLWLRTNQLDPGVHLDALQADFETQGAPVEYFRRRAVRDARRREVRYERRSRNIDNAAPRTQALTEAMMVAAIAKYFPASLQLSPVDGSKTAVAVWDHALALTGGLLEYHWGLRPSQVADEGLSSQNARWLERVREMAREAGAEADAEWTENCAWGHTVQAQHVLLGIRQEGGKETWYPAHEWAGIVQTQNVQPDRQWSGCTRPRSAKRAIGWKRSWRMRGRAPATPTLFAWWLPWRRPLNAAARGTSF
jgi:hypothetical protein